MVLIVSINRNFGVKVANTQPPAQEAVTKNDKNGTTKKEPAAYPEEQKAAKPKENQYEKYRERKVYRFRDGNTEYYGRK